MEEEGVCYWIILEEEELRSVYEKLNTSALQTQETTALVGKCRELPHRRNY